VTRDDRGADARGHGTAVDDYVVARKRDGRHVRKT
jgi:hypothetical protein